MLIEQQPNSSAKMSFVFDAHGASPEFYPSVKSEYEGLLRQSFVPGELNICLLESANKDDKSPGIVFPENAQDFYFDWLADNTIRALSKKGLSPQSHQSIANAIKQRTVSGVRPDFVFAAAILGGINQLNSEGFNIGIAFEDGVSYSQKQHSFSDFELPLNLPAYKRMIEDRQRLHHMRDVKIIEQITKIIDGAKGAPINLLVARGTFHGELLELLPSEYKDCIKYAETKIYEGDQEEADYNLSTAILSGREPSEQVWKDAHDEYERIRKSEHKNILPHR